MKAKYKAFKNGAYAAMDDYVTHAGTWYECSARSPSGYLLDRMRCDDYRMALEYYRAFCKLAKAS